MYIYSQLSIIYMIKPDPKKHETHHSRWCKPFQQPVAPASSMVLLVERWLPPTDFPALIHDCKETTTRFPAKVMAYPANFPFNHWEISLVFI